MNSSYITYTGYTSVCALTLVSLLAGIRRLVVCDLGATEIANELLCALANTLRQQQTLAFGVPLGCKTEQLKLLKFQRTIDPAPFNHDFASKTSWTQGWTLHAPPICGADWVAPRPHMHALLPHKP
jgi:hypothetical protein